MKVDEGADEAPVLAEARQLMLAIHEEFGVRVDSGVGAAAVHESSPGLSTRDQGRIKPRKWSTGELVGLRRALEHYGPIMGERRRSSARSGVEQEVATVGAVTMGAARGKPSLAMAGEYIASHQIFNLYAVWVIGKDFGGGAKEIEGTATHELAHGLLKYALPEFSREFGNWDAEGKPCLAEGVEPPHGTAATPSADFLASIKAYLLTPDTFMEREPKHATAVEVLKDRHPEVFVQREGELAARAAMRIVNELRDDLADFTARVGTFDEAGFLNTAGEKPITLYAATSPNEDLSETAKFYFVDPDTLRAEAPLRAAFFNRLVAGWTKPGPATSPDDSDDALRQAYADTLAEGTGPRYMGADPMAPDSRQRPAVSEPPAEVSGGKPQPDIVQELPETAHDLAGERGDQPGLRDGSVRADASRESAGLLAGSGEARLRDVRSGDGRLIGRVSFSDTDWAVREEAYGGLAGTPADGLANSTPPPEFAGSGEPVGSAPNIAEEFDAGEFPEAGYVNRDTLDPEAAPDKLVADEPGMPLTPDESIAPGGSVRIPRTAEAAVPRLPDDAQARQPLPEGEASSSVPVSDDPADPHATDEPPASGASPVPWYVRGTDGVQALGDLEVIKVNRPADAVEEARAAGIALADAQRDDPRDLEQLRADAELAALRADAELAAELEGSAAADGPGARSEGIRAAFEAAEAAKQQVADRQALLDSYEEAHSRGVAAQQAITEALRRLEADQGRVAEIDTAEATTRISALPATELVDVPAIVVTSPEGEVATADRGADPGPAGAGAAPLVPAAVTGDPSPWYFAHGAMGQAIVAGSVETIAFRREQADFWAEQISSRLDLRGRGPHTALRSGIRSAVSDLLVTSKPKEWDDILAAGRTLVVDGRLVWLRPVMRDLTPVPRAKGEVNEYPVGFASTATGGRSGHEVTQGVESTLLTLVNLGAGAAASAAAIPIPQLHVGSSKSKDSGWGRTVLSGRKPFVNALTRFSAGLQMKVFVDGEDATPTAFHRVTVKDRIHVDVPTAYAGADGHRPDYRAPEAERPGYKPGSHPSEARELLQAVDLTPVIAGLHRNLRAAGLPAPAVKKVLEQAMMNRAPGFLTEPTARSRYLWWAGGDSSNGIEVSGSLFGTFRGHLRIRREIDSLQYLGDSKVGTRDDIGVGDGSSADSEGGSDAGVGFGYNTAGVGAGGDAMAEAEGGTSSHSDSHSEGKSPVKLSGLVPAVGVKVGVSRGAGYSLDSSRMSHTVLNDFAEQSRYRAGLRLEVTMESSTHRIAPVQVTTEAELSVPRREAQHFVRRTVGAGWTADLRPAAGGPDAPRHRVPAPPPPRRVVRLPETTPRFRFRMTLARGAGMLTPHPREPLALASRRGLGFGVPIALPGVEGLQRDLRDAIERLHVMDVGARGAKKSDWSQADRDLASFYGRPALEGDVSQALLGIYRTIEVGGRRYKVAAQAVWGKRMDGPSPLGDPAPVAEGSRPEGDFSMKVNTRAVTGATTAGERGSGWRAAFTFGGGARLAIPEYEVSLGKLHLTTPPIRLQLGAVRGLFTGSMKKNSKYGGAAGSYRRTETGKRVDEHRYLMAVNWTVTPEKTSRSKSSWWHKRRFLSGRNPFIARVVVPHEHVPATPVTPEQAQAAGHTVVSTAPTGIGRRLDFSGGAQGIYPAFRLMPELARLGARMYAEQMYAGEENEAKRQRLIDAWLDNPAEWPEKICDLAHPQVLSSHFGEEVGLDGYGEELPKDGKYKQALRLRILVDNVNDLGANANTEVEQYLKGNAAYESEREGEWGAGVTGTLGPQLRFGSDAQGGEHPSGPGGRLAVLANASAARNWGKGAAQSAGRIDISRATYGGDVHTLRTDPVFELTYVRWRNDKLTETTRYLRATEALDLLVPQRRMSDVLPPATDTPTDTATNTATDTAPVTDEAPAAGAAADAAPVTDGAPAVGVTRTYLDTGLLSGIAHPEVLRVDVLKTINDRLRAKGIIPTESEGTTAPRPNLLQRSLKAAFSSEALQSEWHALTTDGVLRWFPVPGPWGSTRYLWVKVTATQLDRPHGQRPRDEIKLTLRGEAVEEESQSRDTGWEWDAGVDVRARAGNEKGHGGLEAEVEYSASKGTKDEDAEKRVGIYRANPQEPSEEFEHGITFRVEMGTTTELPEVLTTPARGALSVARLFSRTGGPKAGPSVFAWHDPGDRADQLVDGDVRLLAPRHLTVETDQPQQWPLDLTAPRETQVTWLSGRSQNPPAPALPDAFVNNLHPWTVPAAAPIGRWAKLTAVRHRIVPRPQVGRAPEISGLDLTTTAGVRYHHRTSANVMRPRITELLKQSYEVPLGDRSALVGLELNGAEILGPPEGVLLKQRRYHQADEEPTHEVHRDSGWRIAVGPDGGGHVNDQKMLERLPVDIKNWEDSESRSAALGDTDERNAEGKQPYRAYRFDVTAVVNGPHGTVRIQVPGGLYGGLPVDKNTGRLVDGLEYDPTLGPLLRPTPPATETAGQDGVNPRTDTVRQQTRTAEGTTLSDGASLRLVADLNGTATAHYDGTTPDHLEHHLTDPGHTQHANAEQAHAEHQALEAERAPRQQAVHRSLTELEDLVDEAGPGIEAARASATALADAERNDPRDLERLRADARLAALRADALLAAELERSTAAGGPGAQPERIRAAFEAAEAANQAVADRQALIDTYEEAQRRGVAAQQAITEAQERLEADEARVDEIDTAAARAAQTHQVSGQDAIREAEAATAAAENRSDLSDRTPAEVVLTAWQTIGSGYALPNDNTELAAAQGLSEVSGARILVLGAPGPDGSYTIRGRAMTSAQLAEQIAARLTADGEQPPRRLVLHGPSSAALARELSTRLGRLVPHPVDVIGAHGDPQPAGSVTGQIRQTADRFATAPQTGWAAYRDGTPIPTGLLAPRTSLPDLLKELAKPKHAATAMPGDQGKAATRQAPGTRTAAKPDSRSAAGPDSAGTPVPVSRPRILIMNGSGVVPNPASGEGKDTAPSPGPGLLARPGGARLRDVRSGDGRLIGRVSFNDADRAVREEAYGGPAGTTANSAIPHTPVQVPGSERS